MTSTPNRRQVKVGEDALSFRMKDENRRYLTLQPTAPPDLIKLMAARGVVFSQARPPPPPAPRPPPHSPSHAVGPCAAAIDRPQTPVRTRHAEQPQPNHGNAGMVSDQCSCLVFGF